MESQLLLVSHNPFVLSVFLPPSVFLHRFSSFSLTPHKSKCHPGAAQFLQNALEVESKLKDTEIVWICCKDFRGSKLLFREFMREKKGRTTKVMLISSTIQ